MHSTAVTSPRAAPAPETAPKTKMSGMSKPSSRKISSASEPRSLPQLVVGQDNIGTVRSHVFAKLLGSYGHVAGDIEFTISQLTHNQVAVGTGRLRPARCAGDAWGRSTLWPRGRHAVAVVFIPIAAAFLARSCFRGQGTGRTPDRRTRWRGIFIFWTHRLIRSRLYVG